jgi:Ca2+-binding EF-hand superfamily protein
VISAEEFFESIHEVKSPFTDALFAVMDMDPSDEIDFEEYIRICATYCLYTREEILRFCFETYDHDGSGAIDEDEFMELCATVNNAAPAFPGNFSTALEQFDVNEDGLIDFNEFCEIDRRFPLVLFPAFRLQDHMQKYTIGETEWLKLIQTASGKVHSTGCFG